MFYLFETVLKRPILIGAWLAQTFCMVASLPAGEPKGRILIKEPDVIDLKILKHEESLSSFTAEEARVIGRLNDVELSINKTGRQVSALGARLSALERDIGQAVAASALMAEKIRALEVRAARRLVAYYKLNNLGRIQMLASAESVHEFLYRKKAFEHILSRDEADWKQLAEILANYQSLAENLKKDQTDLQILREDYQGRLQTLNEEKRQRTRLLAGIRSKKSLETAALDALKKAAALLDRTVSKGIGEEHRPETRAGEPSRAFASLKGGLMMPVKGKIVSMFGAYRTTKFNVKIFRSGIDIQADFGEPIRAVHGGKVIYADWLKGYGNMIVIAHGPDYHTVYAHAQELFKSRGDGVEAGEVIATVGDTGSLTGPDLYFEVRYRGKPVDPLKWIQKG